MAWKNQKSKSPRLSATKNVSFLL